MNNAKNEEYIEELKRNIWDGTLIRLEMGLFPGKAPYGYKNYRPSENETSYFIFFEGRCDYMREAFELFATSLYSEEELARKLDTKYAQLTKKPDGKRLSELLRNPFYYGDFIYMQKLWKGSPELHPQLISYDLWKKVQQVLSKRRNNTVKERAHPYLGMMTCGGIYP